MCVNLATKVTFPFLSIFELGFLRWNYSSTVLCPPVDIFLSNNTKTESQINSSGQKCYNRNKAKSSRLHPAQNYPETSGFRKRSHVIGIDRRG